MLRCAGDRAHATASRGRLQDGLRPLRCWLCHRWLVMIVLAGDLASVEIYLLFPPIRIAIACLGMSCAVRAIAECRSGSHTSFQSKCQAQC